MTKNYQFLKDELSKVGTSKTKEEMIFLCFLLSKKENIENIEELTDSIYNQYLYIRAVDLVFSNKEFILSIDRILKGKDSEEDRLFIYFGLILIGFLLSLIFKKLTKDKILLFKKALSMFLGRISKELNTENLAYLLEKVIREEYPHYKYPFKIVNDFYYKNIKNAHSIMGSILLIMPRVKMLKKSLKLKEKNGKSVVFKKIDSIYGNIYKTRKSLESYCKCDIDINYFIDILVHKNEKNTFLLIEKVIEDLNHVEGRSFHETIIEKIKKAKGEIKIIDDYALNNFSAFTESDVNDDSEWSNKIYLVSKKTLSIFDVINEAKNQNWKVKVAMFELNNWLNEIHKIINKFEIEDDWELIKDLTDQENNKIEWKSTFYTSTEHLFTNEEKEKEREKELMDIVATTILSMINTDGGNILVGLIENPDRIRRDNVKKNTIIKKGISFFNVDHEFLMKNKNIDYAKRELLEILYNKTGYSSEKFNQLFSIKKIVIKDEEYNISNIYLIEVNKADDPIFSREKRGEGTWISILKRANGKTVNADPRDYL
ncbi:MAG: hypothetical protein WC938_02635 [Candidatus Paceibacterota bacterium]|jgi:hypothetical protein